MNGIISLRVRTDLGCHEMSRLRLLACSGIGEAEVIRAATPPALLDSGNEVHEVR